MELEWLKRGPRELTFVTSRRDLGTRVARTAYLLPWAIVSFLRLQTRQGKLIWLRSAYRYLRNLWHFHSLKRFINVGEFAYLVWTGGCQRLLLRAPIMNSVFHVGVVRNEKSRTVMKVDLEGLYMYGPDRAQADIKMVKNEMDSLMTQISLRYNDRAEEKTPQAA